MDRRTDALIDGHTHLALLRGKKRSESISSDYLSDILTLVDLAILGIESNLAKNVDFDSIINLFAAL